MFFVFLLLGGVIYATDRTYPGDSLYPFKLKFEDFALATSKILNKQVDFSIDLVARRSKEAAKILTPKNSGETLSRLDTQVELTATSISQISDPVEKKKAAEKYIVKLNEVSSVLSEKQKEFIQPTTTQPTLIQPTVQQPAQDISVKPTVSQNIIPTTAPTTVPTPTSAPVITTNNTQQTIQQINNTQQTIQQTITEMTNLTINNDVMPTENGQQKNKQIDQKDRDFDKKNEDQEKNKDKKD